MSRNYHVKDIIEIIGDYLNTLVDKHILLVNSTGLKTGVLKAYDIALTATNFAHQPEISIGILLSDKTTYYLHYEYSPFTDIRMLMSEIYSDIYLDENMEKVSSLPIYKALTEIDK